jgi:hypothetical protein
MSSERDYKQEYREYHGRPDQIKRRAGRNKARRLMIKKGLARKGDGQDVHHRNGDTLDNRSANLSIMSRSKNRGIKT